MSRLCDRKLMNGLFWVDTRRTILVVSDQFSGRFVGLPGYTLPWGIIPSTLPYLGVPIHTLVYPKCYLALL